MQITEKFLQFIWKFKLLGTSTFKDLLGNPVEVKQFGALNLHSGPDFFNGSIRWNDQVWVGNIELHIKTSDWFRHGHQKDAAYNNVILHVVYENDLPLDKQALQYVPLIELKSYIPHTLLHQYQQLSNNLGSLPCQKQLRLISEHNKVLYLERLIIDRLEYKLKDLQLNYAYTINHWKELCYQTIAGNFGFKINQEPFQMLARHLPLNLILKHKNNPIQLEALLFGQAGFLDDTSDEAYFRVLQNEYAFLRHKYQLHPLHKSIWKMMRLRPANFPSLRIAQFAALMEKIDEVLNAILNIGHCDQVYDWFAFPVSPYWQTHYTFDKTSAFKSAKMGKESMNNIIINSIAPLQFFYGKLMEDSRYELQAIQLLESIEAEKNQIIHLFKNANMEPRNASESQALIQLYNFKCKYKKCLECQWAYEILKSA